MTMIGAERVWVTVGENAGVSVCVGNKVKVGETVGDGLEVTLGVLEGVGVPEAVAVSVGVAVMVKVGVTVTVGVSVTVGLGVPGGKLAVTDGVKEGVALKPAGVRVMSVGGVGRAWRRSGASCSNTKAMQ